LQKIVKQLNNNYWTYNVFQGNHFKLFSPCSSSDTLIIKENRNKDVIVILKLWYVMRIKHFLKYVCIITWGFKKSGVFWVGNARKKIFTVCCVCQKYIYLYKCNILRYLKLNVEYLNAKCSKSKLLENYVCESSQ